MADDAVQEPPADQGNLSLQTSSATVSVAEQPTIAKSFHRFAFLPEEIRRLIWQQACIQPRIHFLEFPSRCTLPGVGMVKDPADAPSLNYYGVRDDLAMLIAKYDNYTKRWSVSGCRLFRRFYWRRDFNRIGAVCPEARNVHLSLINDERSQKALKKSIHVNESFDIFHFYPSRRPDNIDDTTFLLRMRPKLCPMNLAICVEFYDQDSTFSLDEGGQTAVHKFPRWLLKAIEWGREAKEGHMNSPATTLTPSIDDVAINLKDLKAVFLIDFGITLRKRSKPRSRPSAHQYSTLAHGMGLRFYALSPENKEMMEHWDVPAHVWPALEETKRVIGSSDDWKVNIHLMAPI